MFMGRFWRELARSPGALAYDAAFPRSCSAALYLRCGDAEATIAAAQAIAGHENNADALTWLAVARHRKGGLEACRNTLMRLALLAPEHLPVTLSEIDDPLLARNWNAFQADCHWLDTEQRSAGLADAPHHGRIADQTAAS